MPDLERQLALLGREVHYPATPPLAQAVAERLAAGGPAGVPGRRISPRRMLAIAIAAVLLLVGGAVAAVPAARNAVLDFVGLRGATVERVTTSPTAPGAARLDLGQRTSLAAARRSLAFRALIPRRLGGPDAVFLRKGPAGGELSLVYRPRSGLPRSGFTRVGLLATEFRGDLVPQLIGKLVGPSTHIDRLTIGGHRAVWISGAPHEFFYRGPGGGIRAGTVRLAANVLLLERGRRLIRLEGAFGEQTAIAIARSLR